MMPIGIPKVVYKVPGASAADWVNIYDRMYRERIIFLGQQIDDAIVNQIIAVMLCSDAEDPNKPLSMYINSPGGSVVAGLALYDTMQLVSSPITTVNIGMAASMVRPPVGPPDLPHLCSRNPANASPFGTHHPRHHPRPHRTACPIRPLLETHLPPACAYRAHSSWRGASGASALRCQTVRVRHRTRPI